MPRLDEPLISEKRWKNKKNEFFVHLSEIYPVSMGMILKKMVCAFQCILADAKMHAIILDLLDSRPS